jgi:hypothetical protein
MVGTQGLKCTPKTVAYMNRCNDHGKNIDSDIGKIGECTVYYLINGGIGFIYKVEINQMQNDKGKKDKTGIGHCSGTYGTASGTFVD